MGELVILSQIAESASNRANGTASLAFFVLSGVLIAAGASGLPMPML